MAYDLTAQGEWTLPADVYGRPKRYTTRPECLTETMFQLERVRNDPDGTRSEGHVDAQGKFVPDSPSSSAKGKARKHRVRNGT